MLGAILAGSGQREGIFLGTMVGMFNGVLSVLVRSGPVQELTTVAVYGQPLVQTAFGALAGWIGCTVWKPLPTATVPGGSRLVRKKPVRRKVSLFAGRVAWVRVAAGAALAVIGSLSATIILEIVLAAAAASNSNTRVSYGSDFVALQQMQDQIVTWEIKALAVLVGGAVAGSNTHNGLKQGLCVGVASGSMLVISLGVTHRAAFDVAGLTLISVLSLSLVGGWFGSQLLPPVVPVKRLRGLGPEA
jgi:hypothetical protein